MSRYFTDRERDARINWIDGCTSTRANLDAVVKKKISIAIGNQIPVLTVPDFHSCTSAAGSPSSQLPLAVH